MTGGWRGILLCSGRRSMAEKFRLESEAKLPEVWVLLGNKL